MTVVLFRPARMEVWAGRPEGSSETRWYVERIEAGDDGGFIASDFGTEEEAVEEAREWELPIFVKR